MTYSISIPLPSDKLRNFPGDVTTNNWPRLKTIIEADHVFNNAAASTDGYHKVIHFQNQGSAPATVSGVGQMYTKTVGTDQQVFFKSGLGTERQVTGAFLNSSSGYVTLANGFILQWGSVASTSSGTVTFPVAFTSVYAIQTTGYYTGSAPNGAAGIATKTNGTTNFAWVFNTNSGSYNGFYWMAIGV